MKLLIDGGYGKSLRARELRARQNLLLSDSRVARFLGEEGLITLFNLGDYLFFFFLLH